MSQSKSHSMFESINAAAFAAPTAIGLHKFVLWIAGDCAMALADCNNDFLLLSWIIFFTHSVMWKYIIRRVHDKYHVELNPKGIYKSLKKRLHV